MITEMTDWQPIETAPKDGSYILAWCVHANAKYSAQPISDGYEQPVVAHWLEYNGGGWMWHGMLGEFTHWMPLPAPPKEPTND